VLRQYLIECTNFRCLPEHLEDAKRHAADRILNEATGADFVAVAALSGLGMGNVIVGFYR